MSHIDMFGCQGSCGNPVCCCKQKSIVLSGFTGDQIVLVALTQEDFEPDELRVYWNGMRLAYPDDYNYSGNVLTFTEPKEDCRIIIDYMTCSH